MFLYSYQTESARAASHMLPVPTHLPLRVSYFPNLMIYGYSDLIVESYSSSSSLFFSVYVLRVLHGSQLYLLLAAAMFFSSLSRLTCHVRSLESTENSSSSSLPDGAPPFSVAQDLPRTSPLKRSNAKKNAPMPQRDWHPCRRKSIVADATLHGLL